jgi:predicted kinase
MARCLIWRLWPEVSSIEFIRMREAIVALVRHHGLPLYFVDRTDPYRAVIEAATTTRLDWASVVAEADVRGRIWGGQSELLDRIAMFQDFAAESKCLHGPYEFPTDHTRFMFFRKPGVSPDVEYYDDSQFTVTLVCGLPASGKDTWIRQNLHEIPVISLDDVRAQLHVLPVNNQGRVVYEARERARQFLRRGQSFAWNATNTSRMVRRQLVDLFTSYRAKVRIVYVETSINELNRRNRNRTISVPNNVIERLRRRLDVPDATEATHLDWVAA